MKVDVIDCGLTRYLAFRWISGWFHFYVEWRVFNWSTAIIHIDSITANIVGFVGYFVRAILVIDNFRRHQKTLGILQQSIPCLTGLHQAVRFTLIRTSGFSTPASRVSIRNEVSRDAGIPLWTPGPSTRTLWGSKFGWTWTWNGLEERIECTNADTPLLTKAEHTFDAAVDHSTEYQYDVRLLFAEWILQRKHRRLEVEY